MMSMWERMKQKASAELTTLVGSDIQARPSPTPAAAPPSPPSQPTARPAAARPAAAAPAQPAAPARTPARSIAGVGAPLAATLTAAAPSAVSVGKALPTTDDDNDDTVIAEMALDSLTRPAPDGDEVSLDDEPETSAADDDASPTESADGDDWDALAAGGADEDEATDDESDDWAGLDPKDWEGYWLRVHAIEEAGNRSDEDLAAEIRKQGLKNRKQFDRMNETFQRHFGSDPAFMQAAIDARMKGMKQQMADRAAGELKGELAPFEGVSLEQWAWLMAKIAGGGNLAELLALAKMDQPKWDRVSAEWNARMSRDTTATIATVYGQAFVATGPGPFAEAGAATAAAMLDPNQKGVGGQEPCTMERWIEITEAQAAASAKGIDASTVLKSFGLSPAEWGTIGGWWSQHFTANAMKLMGEYNRLQQKYKEKYAGGFVADGIDF